MFVLCARVCVVVIRPLRNVWSLVVSRGLVDCVAKTFRERGVLEDEYRLVAMIRWRAAGRLVRGARESIRRCWLLVVGQDSEPTMHDATGPFFPSLARRPWPLLIGPAQSYGVTTKLGRPHEDIKVQNEAQRTRALSRRTSLSASSVEGEKLRLAACEVQHSITSQMAQTHISLRWYHSFHEREIMMSFLIFPLLSFYPKKPTRPCTKEDAMTPDRCKEEKNIYAVRSTSFLRRPWYCFFSAGVWKAPCPNSAGSCQHNVSRGRGALGSTYRTRCRSTSAQSSPERVSRCGCRGTCGWS